jgi:mycothiol synthase
MTARNVGRLIELARAQVGEPGAWSLAIDSTWVEWMYAGPGVFTRRWEMPDAELSGSAAVRAAAAGLRPVVVTSMLRAGYEGLWGEQLAWIESTIEKVATAPGAAVQVVSESLHDDEVARWASAGFDIVFEELAMELDLAADHRAAPPPWPAGARVLEWGSDAAAASFTVYEAAFRDRPGFPDWTRAEWTARLAGGDDFLPGASLCVLIEDVPAGFVVSSSGWIDQVGVVPAHRRAGLASRLVTEAAARMRTAGMSPARLHVNTNNPGALAAWRALGWKVVGRRGRFERGSIPR